jgi:U4/U6 small nuclear ribonucleoprotein PRP31
MATLADSFLADLDDLSDDEAPDDVAAADASVPQSAQDGERGSGGAGSSRPSGDTLNAVSQLTGSERYARVVAQVREALAADAKAAASSGDGTAASSQPHLGVVDENAYRLIVECNALSADIDDEIQTVHNFVRDQYRVKFPELESLVTHPIDYARVVRSATRWTSRASTSTRFCPPPQ